MTTSTTNLEKKTFNALIDICMDDYEANIKELSESTGIEISSLRGVVGSLVKKGLAQCNTEIRQGKKFEGINPIVNEELFCFGCDSYDFDDASIKL